VKVKIESSTLSSLKARADSLDVAPEFLAKCIIKSVLPVKNERLFQILRDGQQILTKRGIPSDELIAFQRKNLPPEYKSKEKRSEN